MKHHLQKPPSVQLILCIFLSRKENSRTHSQNNHGLEGWGQRRSSLLTGPSTGDPSMSGPSGRFLWFLAWTPSTARWPMIKIPSRCQVAHAPDPLPPINPPYPVNRRTDTSENITLPLSQINFQGNSKHVKFTQHHVSYLKCQLNSLMLLLMR